MIAKTDWKKGDYFNLSDHKRITENIRLLHYLIEARGYSIPALSFSDDLTYESMLLASEIMAIQTDLTNCLYTDEMQSWYSTVQYVMGGRFPSFDELNAIESVCLRIYEKISTEPMFESISGKEYAGGAICG